MYKCCLCGNEYEDAADAVRCVNRCGRQKFQDGTFVKKDSKYSGETTQTIFLNDFTFDFTEKEIEDEIRKISSQLIDLGASSVYVNRKMMHIFLTWPEKSKGDKIKDLKHLIITLSMYVKN